MLKKYFCPSFSRKKPGCHNVVKTWKINLKTKTKKKNSKKHPLDRTLHENTGPNLCFSLHIGKALYLFSYWNLLLFFTLQAGVSFQQMFLVPVHLIMDFLSLFSFNSNYSTVLRKSEVTKKSACPLSFFSFFRGLDEKHIFF